MLSGSPRNGSPGTTTVRLRSGLGDVPLTSSRPATTLTPTRHPYRRWHRIGAAKNRRRFTRLRRESDPHLIENTQDVAAEHLHDIVVGKALMHEPRRDVVEVLCRVLKPLDVGDALIGAVSYT